MYDKANPFVQIATEIGQLVEEKNQAYGDSFAKTGDFLRLLYPDGIPPEKYADALCLVRMWDKMKRIATDRDALGESPYRDIAGYALLGIRMSEARRYAEHISHVRTHLTAGDSGIDKGI